MTSLTFMLMMQFLVSTKAGLVNYVQGSTNVKATTSVLAGVPVGTGPGGFVEILLNPGSYLRLDENSEAVLDRVELTDVSLRILRGTAVIEATGFGKDAPLKVTTGKLKVEIIKDGIYVFSNDKVTVVDGKIRDANNGLVYTKGYQLSDDQGYRAQKVKTFTTPIELWSRKRDELIAAANLNIVRSLRDTPNLPLTSFLDVWLWVPSFGAFVYMPGNRYRSPYGYSYTSVEEVYYRGSGSATSASSGSGGRLGGNESVGNAAASSGFGGGGGFSAPSPGPSSSAPPQSMTPAGSRPGP